MQKNKLTLYLLNFFTKGWLVSYLVILPFIQKDLNLTFIDIGLLSTVITVASILAAFYAHKIHQHLSARNTLIICLVVTVLSWLGFLVVKIPGMIWIIYILGGISSGLFDPIASAIIARNASKDTRSKEIGDYTATGDLGRIALTTATTVLIGMIAWQCTVTTYAIISTILLVLYSGVAPQTAAHIKEEKHISPSSLLQILRNKSYMYALIAGMLDVLSSVSLFIFLPFLLTPKGIQLNETGWYTTLFFFGYFAGRMVLGRFADKFGTVKVLVAAEIIMATLIVSLIYLTAPILIIINLFLLGIVTRGTSPIIKSMITEGLHNHDIEKGYSLYSSCSRTANAVGRSMFGFIGAFLGVASIYYLCSFIALITILPALAFNKENKMI